MGEEGSPQGVLMDREATWVKPGSSRSPVPPMTAIGTGPGENGSGQHRQSHLGGEGQCHVGEHKEHKPSYVEGRAVILRANCAGDSMRRKGLKEERNVGDQRMKSQRSSS